MWMIVKRSKDSKDAITYSYYTGEALIVDPNPFASVKKYAHAFENDREARDICMVLSRNGFDVIVEMM